MNLQVLCGPYEPTVVVPYQAPPTCGTLMTSQSSSPQRSRQLLQPSVRARSYLPAPAVSDLSFALSFLLFPSYLCLQAAHPTPAHPSFLLPFLQQWLCTLMKILLHFVLQQPPLPMLLFILPQLLLLSISVPVLPQLPCCFQFLQLCY